MSGLFPFKGTIRSFKRNRSLLTEDDNSDVAAEYGIRNIPTVLFFKNGEIVDKQVGAVAKPVFVEKVKNLL